MARKTTSDQLKTIIIKLGGTPTGQTISDLVDELEDVVGSGSINEETLEPMLDSYMADHTGSLTSADFDQIFED